MKKPLKLLFAALIAAVMCLPVFGCGETETPPPDSGIPIAGDNMLRNNDFENDDNRVPNRYDQGKPFTLTLQGGTFADGQTSKIINSGRSVSLKILQCTGTIPDGKIVSGWSNVADQREIFDGVLTMPESDLTLEPVFDVASYAPRNGSAGGKIELYPKTGYYEGTTNPGGGLGWMIKEDAGAVQDPRHYWGTVAGERGAVYCYKSEAAADSLPVGWYFTSLSPYKVESDKTYTFSYTLENQGTTPLSLRLYQTNTSSNLKPAATSAAVSLKAGETKTVTITFTGFNNNNVLTTVELATAVPSFRLGMFIYSAIA